MNLYFESGLFPGSEIRLCFNTESFNSSANNEDAFDFCIKVVLFLSRLWNEELLWLLLGFGKFVASWNDCL